jgi:hypothetical protein
MNEAPAAALAAARKASELERWTANEVVRLEADANRRKPDSPFQKLLLLRAAILRADSYAAVADLKLLCEEQSALFASHAGFFAHALAAFVWAYEMEPVAEWVRVNRFGGKAVSVVASGAPKGRNTIDVTFGLDREVCFAFPSTACRQVTIQNLMTRWASLLPMLRRYCDSAAYQPGSITLNCGDGPEAPGLAFCAFQRFAWLIPDAVFLRENGYQKIRDHFEANPVPWEQRLPVAFWRGASTGQRRPGTPWQAMPRVRLAALANTPEAEGLLDAGISKIGQVSAAEGEEMRQAGLLRDYVPATEFNRYRYNIDIDGNSNAWAGLFQKLFAGGVVMKVASPGGYRQWYYDRMLPWVHFVPVETDLSDLLDKVKWLRAHDSQAAAIAARGREFAMSMTVDSETERATRTIAEGIRRMNGGADIELTFGLHGTVREFLRDGWRGQDAQRTWCRGPVSELVLPAPTSLAAWNLELEVDAFVQPASDGPRPLPAQHLLVLANGIQVGDFSIEQPEGTQIACTVPSHVVARDAELRLTFIHPDGEMPAKFAADGGLQPLSLGFRRLSLGRVLE